ncbi:MAG: Rieske 2Fe-2S domain-containing protein [Boseongicola sp. SB0667_bin_21]|nr:Rieske 2Fe-2S domain-containing protein [Boseongicola sp. SB0667_bin_21]
MKLRTHALQRNAWYAAAMGDEVTREPMRRIILGDPVVLFRKRAGEAVALEDRCCHRLSPLSPGPADRRHDRVSLSRAMLQQRGRLHPCARPGRRARTRQGQGLRRDRALWHRVDLGRRGRRGRRDQDARLALGRGRRLDRQGRTLQHPLSLHDVGRQPDGPVPRGIRAQDHHRLGLGWRRGRNRHLRREGSRDCPPLDQEPPAATRLCREARRRRACRPLADHRVPRPLPRADLQGDGAEHVRR